MPDAATGAPGAAGTTDVHRTTCTVDPAFRVSDVDPRVFGSFVEHLGRCVYTGIHEPGHPTADEWGFRQDVAELVRELGVPITRYPGGNFVSGYRWEDGIGPVGDRPVRLDLAWDTTEPNKVGTDEFMGWARRTGTEPMMAVNLGTRGIAAAAALVEYCNHPGGTYWSDLRRKNGSAEPHGVKVWCLGNEMDGPWQIGAKTAYEYGRLAHEAGKAMRLVDPGIELVACGSSNRAMPTFGTWEETVLRETYDVADYVSLHSYYEQHDDDRGSFLASAVDMDRFIEGVVATCDHVRAVGRHRKRIQLSFDEWNVWFQRRQPPRREASWAEAPDIVADIYTADDAVVVGNLLVSLLKHADRVRMACLAQLVNVIAPIRTEVGGRAWRQTVFHPFALTSRHGRGTVLRVEPRGETYETAWLGEVPLVDLTAVHDEEGGAVTLFAVNRDQTRTGVLDVDVRSLPGLRVAEHVALHGDHEARNTADHPDRVVPQPVDGTRVESGRLEAGLPPASWNLIRLTPTP